MRDSVIRAFAGCAFLAIHVLNATAESQSLGKNHGASGDGNTQIQDVGLTEDGRLIGRIVDSRREEAPQRSVFLYYNGCQIAKTDCDSNGNWQFCGLHGGIHIIKLSDGTERVVRLWTAGAAPKSATGDVRLVGCFMNVATRRQSAITPDCCPSCQCQSCNTGRCRAIQACDGCQGLGLQCVRPGRVVAVAAASAAVIALAVEADADSTPAISEP
ncbi:MAG: hypothetical protein R3E01_15825 [Pirellulaceae bacterium]|nr:hypothetical protein [Planctomycetales bacterium]